MIQARKVDKPLSLYGYGVLGHLAEEIFNELGIPTDFILDAHRKDCPRPKDVLSINKEDLLAVCVTTEPFSGIAKDLSAQGFTDVVPVWDIIESYPEVGLHNGWFAGPFLEKECHECGRILDDFEDNTSRRHYIQHLDWRQYRRDQPLFLAESIGDTLPSTLADIRQRQDSVKCIYYLNDDPNNIMIHAEGKEFEHLEKMVPHYAKYRPKIQVACYHSRDGLWKIPKLLIDNLPDYRFTFRLHAYMGQGAYIYCIPNERIKKWNQKS